MKFARIDSDVGIVIYACSHQQAPTPIRSPRATQCPCELRAYVSTICWKDLETSPFERINYKKASSLPPVYSVMVHEDNLDNWLLAVATLMDDGDVVLHNTMKAVVRSDNFCDKL